MPKLDENIVFHLWCDKEVQEAVEFYASIFPDSSVHHVTTLTDTPSGDAKLVSFELWGQKFMAINGEPYFTLNPSISFMVNFDPSKMDDASGKLEEVWKKLSDGGKVLMPLDKYPFSEKYGWIQDKFGLLWQLILTNPEGEERPPIIPSLLFVGDSCGRAEEALNFYVSVFKNSKQGHIARYPQGMEPNKEGTIMFSDFKLEDVWLTAMDSALNHEFTFNEAISFMVYCDTQEEIDYYWDKLSAVPQFEQCGWLKDKFGVSWQIVPRAMDKMMTNGTAEQINRVNQAVLKMKKLDIAELQKAYNG
nr:VOC family protein [Paenibacillus bovis]